MSHSRSPKGSACGCSRRGRGAGRVPKHRHHSPLLQMPRLDRRTHRPRPLFCSRDRAAFTVSRRAGVFISSVPHQVLPGRLRSGAGDPARKVEPQAPSPRLYPEDRAIPGKAAFPPHSRCGSLRTPLAPPAVPGRSSARPARRRRACAAPGGIPRSSAAGAGLGAAGRAGEFAAGTGRPSSLRGQAGHGQRLPQSRPFLGSCRRSDFARGRPWGGRAEPPRCLRPAASPRSQSAASRSRSDPRGARPGPSRGSLGVPPPRRYRGIASSPKNTSWPAAGAGAALGRFGSGGRRRAGTRAWLPACGGSTRMKDMDNIKTVKKEWVCKSGTDDQILNGAEQNCDYFVDNLFEEAQKVGAMCVPPTTVKNQVDVIIKLWKNGFTVNDGELRSYTDVANQQFLESIKKGELPFELRKVFDKEEVEVKVEDKKDKVYLLSKKPVFHPFSGHGYRLGSATPKIISKVRDDHPGPDDKRHLPLVPLNDLEPITNIQIWLADGERIIQKFNISHRISHVRDFITKYQGSEGSVPFTLTTSLPFQELQDETLTLEEAKLQNAVVVQRLRKTTEPFRLLVIKAPDSDYKTAATPNGQLKNEKKNAFNSARSN